MQTFVQGIYPPTIISTISGNFIVDGKNWIQVRLEEFTTKEKLDFNKLNEYYQKLFPNFSFNKIKNLPLKQWKIKSSSTEEIYNVRLWKDNYFSCECLGFQFRKICKHITNIKEQTNGI